MRDLTGEQGGPRRRTRRVDAEGVREQDALGRQVPTMSVANSTGRSSTSASRSATGASENSSAGLPFGRPRCAHTTTRAPRSARSAIVGALARIRPSSVIRWPSSGTLRSDRTSTFFPGRDPIPTWTSASAITLL